MMSDKNRIDEKLKKSEWRPPLLLQQLIRLAPWGFPRQILMILDEGSQSLEGIINGFSRFMKHFGHYGREEIVAGYTKESLLLEVSHAIERLKAKGLISQHGELFHITSKGRQKAQQQRIEYERVGRRIERLLHPQNVSLVGLGVHVLLAAIKLTAGFISGSIGLITDGIDTAMDGFSSVLVYIGLRFKRERAVNIILVELMLVVGIITGVEAVQRVFHPEGVEVSYVTFVVALVSGLVCLLLSIYQRYVAIRSKQQSLIAQAVDSRNHAIVAAGVMIGLLAAVFGFPLLDTFVGMIVAALILKSGIELALELLRTLRGEEMNFNQYDLGFVEEYRTFQQKQLMDWLLSIISENQYKSREALLNDTRKMLNVQDVPILRELGYRKDIEIDKKINAALEGLIKGGLITTGEGLLLTADGFEVMRHGIDQQSQLN